MGYLWIILYTLDWVKNWKSWTLSESTFNPMPNSEDTYTRVQFQLSPHNQTSLLRRRPDIHYLLFHPLCPRTKFRPILCPLPLMLMNPMLSKVTMRPPTQPKFNPDLSALTGFHCGNHIAHDSKRCESAGWRRRKKPPFSKATSFIPHTKEREGKYGLYWVERE